MFLQGAGIAYVANLTGGGILRFVGHANDSPNAGLPSQRRSVAGHLCRREAGSRP